MTINSQTRTAGPFAGTGAIVPYPFAFKVFQASDLLVTITDAAGLQTESVLSVGHTVALNADQNVNPGGVVTPLAAIAVGASISVTSQIPVLQPASLTNSGGFYPRVIEDALDRLTILMQEYGFVTSRQTLRVPEIGGVPALPAAAARANTVQGYDSDGNPAVFIPASGSASDVLLQLADTSNASKGDALLGVKQLFTGAVGRTQHDKNAELISLGDATGADKTGATSSATAFASAEAAADDIFLPPGEFLAPAGTVLTKRYWGPGRLNYSGIGPISFAGGGLNDVAFSGIFGQPQPLMVKIRINALNVAGISGATSPCDTFEYSLNNGATWISTYDAYNPADDQVYALPLGLNANIGFTGTSVKVGIPGTGVIPTFAAVVGHTLADTWAIPLSPNRHSAETQSGYLTKNGVVFGGIGGLADNNTLLGRGVLGNLNNAGNQLTAIGAEALYANVTGYANTAVGITALRSNTSGNNLTAVGANSLYSNTTGITNTAMGVYACNSNTTGSGNSGFGSDSNGYNATGDGNTAAGVQALYHNVSGQENAAVGRYALRGGIESLSNGTSQSYCTAMGAYALYFGGGQFNAALGHQAGYKNKGNSNTFLGAETCAGNDITGGFNLFAGYRAGQNASQSGTVQNCVVLGDNAYTTGNNAVCIGSGTTAAANEITLGNAFHVTVRTTGNIVPRVDNANNLGSGTFRFATVYAAAGAINTSDEREKTAIRPLTDVQRRVALFLKGRIGAFKFLDSVEQKGDGARWHFGVGAQTVAAAFQAEGLDPNAYGLFCYDEWDAEYIDVAAVFEESSLLDADGKPYPPRQVEPARRELTQPAGNRYGIRYDELAMFILAAL